MKLNRLTAAIASASTVLFGSVSAPVFAQEDTVEEVIVTGTARSRTSFDTPVQVTSFDEDLLRKVSSSSQADILRVVPGVKPEGGGGEVATNVFISGLPSGGQYAFTPLQYDGIPTISSFGLNSSSHDVYARNDLGIERLEFVQGGASNLFGAGSVSGLINYISKVGGDEPESTVQLEVAEDTRMKVDFATSGPLAEGSNNYYALSGWYRYDEGPLDTGLPSEGYQLRGNFRHVFDDDSGHFTIYAQAINDKVQFFLPYPLAGDRSRARGNDGSEVFTAQTAEAEGLSHLTPDGIYETNIRDGVLTEGGSIAFALKKDLSDEWTLNAKAGLKSYTHQFNLFLDGDGLSNPNPLALEDYLDLYGYGTAGVADAANATATFTDSGRAVPDGYLLWGNRVLDRQRPMDDFTAEVSATRTFDMGDLSHAVTIGAYASRATVGDRNNIITYLGEFNDRPQLVDLSITDVDGSLTGTVGNELVISRNGVRKSNGETGNNDARANRYAFYITDQIEADTWSLDIGARFETVDNNLTKERNSSFALDAMELAAFYGLGANETLISDLTSVSTGNGDFQRVDFDDSAVAVSGAFLYKLSDTTNLYFNASSGFFFPQARSQAINEFNEPGPYDEERIQSFEGGVKLSTDSITGSASLFYVELEDRQSVEFINDGQGGVITQANKTSTESTGLKLAGTYNINDYFSVNVNATYQDGEYTKFEGNDAVVGNEMERNPEFTGSIGLNYSNDNFDFSISNAHTGSHFVDRNNNNKVDSFDIINVNAGYTMQVGNNDETLRIGLSVFNIGDTDGITEGSPRAPQAGGAAFFVGRPVLPSRVTLRLTYDF